MLPADIAKARFVRFVLTDEFGDGDGCVRRSPDDFPVTLAADALDNATAFDKEGKSTRPVWITISVPRDAEPGTYTSTLLLSAPDHKVHSFEF